MLFQRGRHYKGGRSASDLDLHYKGYTKIGNGNCVVEEGVEF